MLAIHSVFVYRSLKFLERSHLFAGAHNEALPIAVSVGDPDLAPVSIQRPHVAVARTGFMEIVGDGLPMLRALHSAYFALLATMNKCFTTYGVLFRTQ